MYRVYCLKKKSDNKIIYVGVSKQKYLSNRVYKHYKEKNLSRDEYYHEVLHEYNDEKLALQKETELIIKYDLINKGFNKVTYVGENSSYSKTRFKEENNYGKLGTKKVRCIELDLEFNSLTECAKELNLSISKVSAVCKGQRKTHKGYTFEFI